MPITTTTISTDFYLGSCASRLRRSASYSALALSLMGSGIATNAAQAANYTAGTEAELKAAMIAANNDSDATSTITLTGNLTVAVVSDLPPIGKPLTIDAAGFTMRTTPTSAGYDVAAGATLTLKGDVDGSGTLNKGGQGTLVVTGTGNSYGKNVTVNAGHLRVEAGGQLAFGNGTDGGLRVAGNGTSAVVSGIGSKITTTGNNWVGSAGGGTLTVEAGARFEAITGALSLADAVDATGTLNVRGPGSTVTLSSGLAITKGTGFINITDGAKVQSSAGGIGGSGALVTSTGTGTVIVSGAGSSWSTGQFGVHRGSLSVLDGGVVSTGYIRIGIGSGSVGTVLVSGKGSELIGTTNGGGSTFTDIGNTGAGTLTIADEGKVTVGVAGAGTVRIANGATSQGTLNIGGGTGQAATKAGTLVANKLLFGAGAGVVNFNHTDSAYAFDVALDSGGIIGRGTLNQIGSGKTVLTADQLAFAGKANVYAGTLAVNGALGGTMDVFGGRLQGIGTVGNTINHLGGIIAPGNSIGTLTIAGNYTSNGGMLEIEAELGTDNSPTDLLVVTGDTILGSGKTLVNVINVGGAGGKTIGDGFKIIEVGGASAADAFALAGPAIGGAYRYDLFQNDLTGTLDDGNWYLRSTGLAPTLPVYENHPQVLLGMVALPTLQQRVGNRYWSMLGGAAAGNASDAGQNAIWTRIEGAHGRVKSKASTADASYDSDTSLVQVGLDGQLSAGANGMLIGGLTAQYSRATADIFSSLGDGGNATTSFGIGATLTWYGENGFYVDGQAQIATLRSDLTAAGIGTIGDGIHGSGHALSLEAGRKTALGGGWSLTPQAQLAYASVDFDAFTDRFGANVSLKKGDSVKGRLGISADYEADAGTHVYGITNLTYEFLDGTTVAVSGVDLAFTPQRFGGELGVGGTYAWAGGKYALHGEALASTSFQGGYALKGTAGLTVGF